MSSMSLGGGATMNLSTVYFAANMMMCMCDDGSPCDLTGA